MLNARHTFARRTLAVLLSFALVFSFSPVTGYAEDGAGPSEARSDDLAPATSGDLVADAHGEGGGSDEQATPDVPDGMSATPSASARSSSTRAGTLGEPAHRKILSARPDGTYDLTLTVQGDVQSSQDISKANVIVVLDTSYSMHSSAGSKASRMTVAKRCVSKLATTILSQNASQPDPLIEMSLITFATVRVTTSGWYTDAYSFNDMVDDVKYCKGNLGGTNWEDALQAAKAAADAKYATNHSPTYVIFVSDGLPTFRNTQGRPDWTDSHSGAQHDYGVWGTGFDNVNQPANAESVRRCYEMAKDDARAIVNAGYEFYGISVFQEVGRVTSLVNYAYTGNDTGTDPTGTTHYYHASGQDALNQAFSEIAHNIIKHVYYANVTVHDALDLQNVAFASSGSVPYVLKKELSDGTVITYDSATGATTGGTWNFGTPVFGADGKVSWNPEAGQDALLDAATYSITFQVAPTQQACDTAADSPSSFVPGDNDGDGVDDAMGLHSNVPSEAHVTYYTATVTESGGSTTINQTGPYTAEYNKPVVTPVPAHLTITKHWNGDDQVAATLRPATLHGTVTRDDSVTYPVELVSTGGNTYSASIDVPAGPEGHQYTFAEEQLPDYYMPSEVTAHASAPSYASWGKLYLKGYAEQSASFSITNSFAAFPLTVQKVESGTSVPLSAAQFTLYLDDGDGVFDAASDQLAAVFSDMALTQPVAGSALSTGVGGTATFHGLLAGRRYWLVETRAPTGYNLDSVPHVIEVGLGGTMSTQDSAGVHAELPKYGGISTIVIADEPIPDLPLTAGAGIRTLAVAGACLVFAGLVLAGAVVARRRREAG